MATRKPLVRIGGKSQQLPAADSLDVPGARFHEGTTEPTEKSYGDRWLDTTSGIEYTWVNPGVWVDLSEPTAADVAAAIHAATGKTTPVDADELALADSEASWSLKKLTWANLKAVLLAYFKGQFREKLTADRTYYVRTDGSDSNNGLSNTSGGAFATFQHAFSVVAALDLSVYSATIEAGNAGTYAGVEINAPLIGGVALNLVGNGATISTSTLLGAIFVTAGQSTPINVSGFTTVNTHASGCGIRVDAAARVNITTGMTYSTSAVAHIRTSVPGSYISTSGSYSITSGGQSHILAVEQSGVRVNGGTVTITGTPAFSVGFVNVSLGAHSLISSVTFSGSATGPRYSAATLGVISTNGAGATYLPGDAAGTTATGGVYA